MTLLEETFTFICLKDLYWNSYDSLAHLVRESCLVDEACSQTSSDVMTSCVCAKGGRVVDGAVSVEGGVRSVPVRVCLVASVHGFQVPSVEIYACSKAFYYAEGGMWDEDSS
uniref:Transmembrane protein n=1 Tax=Heterorhabditis bacteriophora TaxID=37862 RepID=A0A1I7WQF8_HETBA